MAITEELRCADGPPNQGGGGAGAAQSSQGGGHGAAQGGGGRRGSGGQGGQALAAGQAQLQQPPAQYLQQQPPPQQMQQRPCQGGGFGGGTREDMFYHMQMLAASGMNMAGIGVQGPMLEFPDAPRTQRCQAAAVGGQAVGGHLLASASAALAGSGQPFLLMSQPQTPARMGGDQLGGGLAGLGALASAERPAGCDMLEAANAGRKHAPAAHDEMPVQPYWALVYQNGTPGAVDASAHGASLCSADSPSAASSAALGGMAAALPCYTNGLSSAGLAYIPQLGQLPSHKEPHPLQYSD